MVAEVGPTQFQNHNIETDRQKTVKVNRGKAPYWSINLKKNSKFLNKSYAKYSVFLCLFTL